MAPEAHALLGASSAHRWIPCPPSAKLELSVGRKDDSSPYAEEGTAAHALAELELSYRLGAMSKRSYSARLRKHRDGQWYGPEMEEAVGVYVDRVAGIVEDMRANGSEPYAYVEQRVDFSAYVPEGFGTADAVAICDGLIHVVDLKYGKGIPVSADHNPQLMLYALGAVLAYKPLFELDTVAMTIVQPRLNASSTFVLSIDELMSWAEETVRPAAELAATGEGDYNPGEAQCRWCRAKAVCRARADAEMLVVREEFGSLDIGAPAHATMGADELAALLPKLPAIERWAKDVQEWCLEQARDEGVHFEGYKLVEGRSSRVITDPEAAVKALKSMGYEPGAYYRQPELANITTLEKLMGKKVFSEVLGDYVDKPAGKPALVPLSDKRPEMGSAQGAASDFGGDVS